MQEVILSRQAIARLPRYLNSLQELHRQQQETVTAPAAAKRLGLNEVQVRKELSAMSSTGGVPRRGFLVAELVEHIEQYLGYHNVDDAVLVGAGALGCALLGNQRFDACGVHIVAAFDRNPGLVGISVHEKPIFPEERIAELCSRMKIRIGIIAVPPDQAQQVCDALLAGGVLAVWNFAPVQLQVPEGILVRDEDLASSLAILSSQLKTKFQNQEITCRQGKEV